MSTEISSVRAWEALDSRGRPTVGCRVKLASGASGRVVVPSGASTGGHEAIELRDGDARYGGAATRHAVTNVETVLGPAVLGFDAADQEALDETLERLDGTDDLGRLGANAVLGVSLAALAAVGDHVGSIWAHLADAGPVTLPMPMVNILSGGAHAARLIDIQDILVVPVGATSFAEAIRWAWEVRAAAAHELRDAGGSDALVADEGGLAAALATNEAAIDLVHRSIGRAGFRPATDVAIAIDVAANQLMTPAGTYRLACEDRELGADEWAREIAGWLDRHPVVSIEDPFHEDAWDDWAAFTQSKGHDCQVLGDDLFATNIDRLGHGARIGAANAVLVKPNQAGTVSRASRVLRTAQATGRRTVVSARSGDTEDDWLADLAVGLDAGQIKVGSVMRSERTAKWNRLLELEATMPVESSLARWGDHHGGP